MTWRLSDRPAAGSPRSRFGVSLAALAMLTISAISGCDEATTDVSPCPSGELVVLGGASFCVNDSSVVTETGFLCSAALPHRFERDGYVICASEPAPETATVDEAVRVARARGQNRETLPDAARNDPPGHSDAGNGNGNGNPDARSDASPDTADARSGDDDDRDDDD